MKFKAIKLIRTTLVIAIATISLAILWGHYPRAIPKPPAWFIDFLVATYQPQNADEVSDLELLYRLVVCFIVSCSAAVSYRAIKKQ